MTRLKDLKSGHLIKKTIGSSNELSFDVLQNKKLQNQKTEEDAPWVISPEAVAKTKKKRIGGKILVISLVTVAILILTILICWGIASWMQQQSGSLGRLQTQISETKRTSENLDDIRDTIQTLLCKDTSEIANSITGDDLQTMLTGANKFKKELENHKTTLTSILEEIATPQEREAANNAITLANKELVFLDKLESISSYCLPYLKVRNYSSLGLTNLIEADSLDRSSSNLITKASIDDAKKAVETSESSKEKAQSAKQNFENAKQINSNESETQIDNSSFEGYINYCQLIYDSQDASIAVANAYISRNEEELVSQNNTYNDLKGQANEISKGWEEQLTDLLDDSYKSKRENDVEAYKQDSKERDSIYKLVKNYVDNIE